LIGNESAFFGADVREADSHQSNARVAAVYIVGIRLER
jgi:hypothetical protein